MNRGSDSILSVYSDARAEYTKQLCVFLVPAYFQFFIELLEKAKQDLISKARSITRGAHQLHQNQWVNA